MRIPAYQIPKPITPREQPLPAYEIETPDDWRRPTPEQTDETVVWLT
jgi:hypothetical protein